MKKVEKNIKKTKSFTKTSVALIALTAITLGATKLIKKHSTNTNNDSDNGTTNN